MSAYDKMRALNGSYKLSPCFRWATFHDKIVNFRWSLNSKNYVRFQDYDNFYKPAIVLFLFKISFATDFYHYSNVILKIYKYQFEYK